MKYLSFKIRERKKKKGVYVVDFTGEHHDEMGKWENGGTFGELVPVGNGFVFMRFITKPTGVYTSLNHFCEDISKQYGIKPVIK